MLIGPAGSNPVCWLSGVLVGRPHLAMLRQWSEQIRDVEMQETQPACTSGNIESYMFDTAVILGSNY